MKYFLSGIKIQVGYSSLSSVTGASIRSQTGASPPLSVIPTSISLADAKQSVLHYPAMCLLDETSIKKNFQQLGQFLLVYCITVRCKKSCNVIMGITITTCRGGRLRPCDRVISCCSHAAPCCSALPGTQSFTHHNSSSQLDKPPPQIQTCSFIVNTLSPFPKTICFCFKITNQLHK